MSPTTWIEYASLEPSARLASVEAVAVTPVLDVSLFTPAAMPLAVSVAAVVL
ncbi:hypothetical protein D3C81_1912160 [compost metagenome]